MVAYKENGSGFFPGSRGATIYGLVLFLAIVISLFDSCTTASAKLDKLETGATLYGILYDADNKAVPSCTVSIDGDTSVSSDVNGRYLFDFVPFGKHSLVFHKTGYEDVNVDIEFSSRTQVAYTRLISQTSLFDSSEKAIKDRKWDEALSDLDRADAIGKNEPTSSYLRAAVLYRLKRYDEARSLLETLVAQEYREPYIYLFLADLYQFHFNAPDKAAASLEIFLSIKEDSEVRTRYEELHKAAQKE